MAKNIEIERKYLVRSDAYQKEAVRQYEIMQGYLCKDHGRTIRVRIRDTRAFLTIKSSIGQEGIGRFEWEKEIEVEDAKQLMALCLPGVIMKTRYIVPTKTEGRVWEVDAFHGRLEGRVLAEIELEDEGEAVELPAWIGEEVTGQPEYYNANM